MFGSIFEVDLSTADIDGDSIFLYHSCETRNNRVNDLSVETPDFVPLHHDHSSWWSLKQNKAKKEKDCTL